MTTLVLTVVGRDRPGLVSALSATLEEYAGNWLTSRMADLAGQFAGIVEVEVAADRAEALVRALGDLDGLTVEAVSGSVETTPSTLWALQVVGDDRPGIVHEVTAALAAAGVGIQELSTETSDAPMAGGVLFHANAVLSAPPGADLVGVRASLEGLTGDLMVDLDVSEG